MFTKRLKELRKARGLSQGALAKELGLSQQAVGKWETGRSTPDPATLAALASFFKVSVDYLLGCGAAPMPGHVLPYLAAEECQIPVIGWRCTRARSPSRMRGSMLSPRTSR